MKKLVCAFMLLWGSVYCADNKKSFDIAPSDVYSLSILAGRALGPDKEFFDESGNTYNNAYFGEGLCFHDGKYWCCLKDDDSLDERSRLAVSILQTQAGKDFIAHFEKEWRKRDKRNAKRAKKNKGKKNRADSFLWDAWKSLRDLVYVEGDDGSYYYSYSDESGDDLRRRALKNNLHNASSSEAGAPSALEFLSDIERDPKVCDRIQQEAEEAREREEEEKAREREKVRMQQERLLEYDAMSSVGTFLTNTEALIRQEAVERSAEQERNKERAKQGRMTEYHSMYNIGVSLRTAERLIEERVRRANEDAEYILLDERLQDYIDSGDIANSCEYLKKYVDCGARGGDLAHLIPLLLDKVLDGRIDDPHLFEPFASLPLWRDLRKKGFAKSMSDDARNAWKALEPFQRFARFLRDDLGLTDGFNGSLPKLDTKQRQKLKEQVTIMCDNAKMLSEHLSKDSDLLLPVFAQLFSIGTFCDSVGMLDEAAILLLAPLEQGSMRARSRLACVYLKQDRVPEAKVLFREFLAACDHDNPTHMERVALVADELYELYCEEKGSSAFNSFQDSDVDDFLVWSTRAGHADACALSDYFVAQSKFYEESDCQDSIDIFKDIVAREEGKGCMKGPAAAYVCVDALVRGDFAEATQYMQYVEEHDARPYNACLIMDEERLASILAKLDENSLTDDEKYVVARACIDSPVLEPEQLTQAAVTLVTLANDNHCYAVAWKEKANQSVLFRAACDMRDLNAIMAGINNTKNIPNGLLMNILSLLLNDLLNEKKAGCQSAGIQYDVLVKGVDSKRNIVVKSLDPALISAVEGVCAPGTVDDKFSAAIQGLIDGASATTS